MTLQVEKLLAHVHAAAAAEEAEEEGALEEAGLNEATVMGLIRSLEVVLSVVDEHADVVAHIEPLILRLLDEFFRADSPVADYTYRLSCPTLPSP